MVSNEAWRSACALQQEIEKQLLPAVQAAKLCVKAGPFERSVQSEGGAKIALASSLPLIKRTKQRKEYIAGWLDIQISLGGNGVPLRADGSPFGPVLHIAHWACEFAFEYDAYVGFPASQWQPWQRKGELLLWDESESAYGDEWLYTLDLAAVNADNLGQLLLTPALALLAGDHAALPADLPGLLRYQDVIDSEGTDLRIAG